MTTNSTHSANPHLYKNLLYDPIKDFEPIARVGMLPFMLVVNPDLPVKTPRNSLPMRKRIPAKLSYGTASTASLIGAETINAMAGSTWSDELQGQPAGDPGSGRGQVAGDGRGLHDSHAACEGRQVAHTGGDDGEPLRIAARCASDRRNPHGFDMTSWNGIFAPAGTPQGDHGAAGKRQPQAAWRSPKRRRSSAAIGFEIAPMGTAEFDRYVRGRSPTGVNSYAPQISNPSKKGQIENARSAGRGEGPRPHHRRHGSVRDPDSSPNSAPT